MKLEVQWSTFGTTDVRVPDHLVEEAVAALDPGDIGEPDVFEVWGWIKKNRPDDAAEILDFEDILDNGDRAGADIVDVFAHGGLTKKIYDGYAAKDGRA